MVALPIWLHRETGSAGLENGHLPGGWWRALRILALVTDAFGGRGGIAKYNQDLLRTLCAREDCSEVVALPRLMPDQPESLPDTLTYLTEGLGGKLQYINAVIKHALYGRNYDLIICGHINLTPIARLASFWARAPVILPIHGIDAWQPTSSRLSNYLAARLAAVVSVSELTLTRFRSWSDSDLSGFVLPNMVDLDFFTPGPKSAALQQRYGLEGKTVLMTMGRQVGYERYKGFDEVLNLLPNLRKEMPTVAYIAAGDGNDRERLEAKARALGVDDLVVFTGYIAETEKVDYYRLADAYVMPSRGEGFGIVLLEAMACGVPVVASKLDGTREAVRDGALGVLVDPGDPEDIKAGILAALKRPRGIVPRGLDYFSSASFEKRCNRIVDQVLSDSRSQAAMHKHA